MSTVIVIVVSNDSGPVGSSLLFYMKRWVGGLNELLDLWVDIGEEE